MTKNRYPLPLGVHIATTKAESQVSPTGVFARIITPCSMLHNRFNLSEGLFNFASSQVHVAVLTNGTLRLRASSRYLWNVLSGRYTFVPCNVTQKHWCRTRNAGVRYCATAEAYSTRMARFVQNRTIKKCSILACEPLKRLFEDFFEKGGSCCSHMFSSQNCRNSYTCGNSENSYSHVARVERKGERK